MLYSPYPFKRCSICGEEYPRTTRYFLKRKGARDGLRGECRSCHNKATAAWGRAHPEYTHEKGAKWDREHREKRRVQSRKRYSKKRQIILERAKMARQNNPDKYRQRDREWYKNHAEQEREETRQYHRTHREQALAYQRKNVEKTREYVRAYRRRNPDKQKMRDHARIARKHAIPDGMTTKNWQHALNYFNGCCAVCGKPAGLFHTIAADHWIPLSKGGYHTPDNIIPLCHDKKDGQGSCNNSKSNRDPIEWLTQKFGPRKAKQILERIEAYFAWVKIEHD